jgi:aspartyl-tRNA(Asn)/glutamyl-tRNA(Gln) amidotransferase subunit B
MDDAYILTRDRDASKKFDELAKELDKELVGKAAKLVVNKKVGMDAEAIKEMLQPKETDEGLLDEIVDKVIADNAAQVEAYKNGKESLLMFFVGQVMKGMKGHAF